MKVFPLSLLLSSLLLASCSNIKDGEYLGGFVHVSGFGNGKEQKTEDQSESPSDSTEVNQEPQEPDYSAKARAQGVCWVGCPSKEPSPMDALEFRVSGVDVDTAYVRIKREFNFKTRSERLEANPNLDGWLEHTLDFRYQATPGVNYLMRGYKEHVYLQEESPNTLQVEIYKDGVSAVLIKASFYSGNTSDVDGYKASLKNRILSSING